jgi:L-fucose isomerase-like protein
MYGVEKVYLMFDNELSEVGGTAMIETTKKLQRKGIAVEVLQCPAKDASKALESVQKFERLKAILEGAASQAMPSAVTVGNDVIEEY